MRRITSLIAAGALTLTVAPAVAQSPEIDPDRIPLPQGWQPEGIAAGPTGTLYVGSIPTGAVLTLNPDTGETETVVRPKQGRAAIGIKATAKRIVVAGGPTGKAFVYTRAGKLVKAVQFGKRGKTFVNDVTITNGKAYFTDSQRSVIYQLRTNGKRPRTIKVPEIPSDEDFNLNGIVSAGKHLLAVHSGDGDLYRITRKTGKVVKVDLGGAKLTNGDGLLLSGRKLFVVQNRDNKISTFDMHDRYRAGEKAGELTNEEFDVPTTIAGRGSTLYAVNARFGTENPESAEYWVTTVPR